MRIVLVGISCVGKTTIGQVLAQTLGFAFIDFDHEVEAHFGCGLGTVKKRFLTPASFRHATGPLLADCLARHPDQGLVLASCPSGLHAPYYRFLRRASATVVALTDSPENILKRLSFFDDHGRPIAVPLTPAALTYYRTDIRKDLAYFGRFYRKADLHFDVSGATPVDAAARLGISLRIPFRTGA